MNLAAIPHQLDAKAATCRAVIETPKGRRTKFNYDQELEVFRLKSLLPDGMSFPMDFGFIPSTLAGDGDPLDVMVLSDEPNPTGAVLDVRLLGAIEAEDTEDGRRERNDRLLAAAGVSSLYEKVMTVQDLGADFVENLVKFWVNKDELESKSFRSLGVVGPGQAVDLVRKAAAARAKG